MFNIDLASDILRQKEIYLGIFLLIINLITYIMMGIDKHRARNNKWRIKEKSFFLLALIGGAIGIILGMTMFRHKTQHKTFYIGIPFLYLFNKIIAIFIYLNFLK